MKKSIESNTILPYKALASVLKSTENFGLYIKTIHSKAKSIVPQHEKSVTYDESGNLVEVEMELNIDQLPDIVVNHIKKHHTKNIITEASEIIGVGSTVIYKAMLKGLDLFFNSNGVFINSIHH